MKKLSPNKTFQYIVRRLFEIKGTYLSLAFLRNFVNDIIMNTEGYKFYPIYIPDDTCEKSLVFAVGDFDEKNGYYPMHLEFIRGELIPMYGLDKCVVARSWNHIFASLEYTRKLLDAPELTEHQLGLIVDCVSDVQPCEYMTDLLLEEYYIRMLDGEAMFGPSESFKTWNISIKSFDSEDVESYTVHSLDELIKKIQECLDCDSTKIQRFVTSSRSGEIHTPDKILAYNRAGYGTKMYIDPKCGKYVTESI